MTQKDCFAQVAISSATAEYIAIQNTRKNSKKSLKKSLASPILKYITFLLIED
jgi:hypothetical protein